MLARPAVLSDVPALTAIWHRGWHDAHDGIVPDSLVRLRTLANFDERLRRDLPDVLVIGNPESAGQPPTGFSMIRGAELFQFYVAAAARGTGVAQTLMHATEAHMASLGVEAAWLACAVGNDRASRFYEKCGWQRTGIVTIDSETPEGPVPLKVWRYEKRLRPKQ